VDETKTRPYEDPSKPSDEETDPCLVFLHGSRMGQLVPLDVETLTMGRGEECDLRIEGPGVSRLHCRIGRDSGGYYLEDLGSTNGTRVNKALVECVTLDDGDLIAIGDTLLRFVGERRLARRRILVVDDDLAYLRLLESLLEQWGFQVATADSLATGRQALLEGKPHLLIIDYVLPDGTGLELLQEHREALQETAVVMITGVAVDNVQVATDAIRLGAFEFLTKPFDPEQLKSIVDRCLEAMESRIETLQELRVRERLPGQLIDLLEQERKNLAMELHDEIGQTLTRLKMEAELLSDGAPVPASSDSSLHSLITGLAAALEQVRFISWGLHPASLDAMGLEHALRLLAAELGQAGALKIHVYFSGLDGRLAREQELAVYRIIQEALTNVLRHSEATAAYIDVIRSDESISITIEDDGIGFDPQQRFEEASGPRGIGLLTIRERAERLGGRTEIASSPGRGTCLSIEIPITSTPAGDEG
jgi:signal transduction histidine kinase